MIDLEAIRQRLAAAKGEHRHVFVAHAEEDVEVLVEEVERLRAELEILPVCRRRAMESAGER